MTRGVRTQLAVLLALGVMLGSGGCLRKWFGSESGGDASAEEAARAAEPEAGTVGPPVESGQGEVGGDAGEAAWASGGGALGGTPMPAESFMPTPGMEPGLEVAMWTASDAESVVSMLLDEYDEQAMPIDPERVDAWRQRGFRLVAVPVSELGVLSARARPIGGMQRQRYGQLTGWEVLARGPAIEASAGGAIPGGRPRLIARAWLEPTLTTGQLRQPVRIELGVQIERSDRPRFTLEPGEIGSVREDGVAIEGLWASFAADGTTALVVVGEAPGVESGSADGPGPTEPGGRTLGEQMLSAPAERARRGRAGAPARRVIVAIIPRAGGSANDAGEGSGGSAGVESVDTAGESTGQDP